MGLYSRGHFSGHLGISDGSLAQALGQMGTKAQFWLIEGTLAQALTQGFTLTYIMVSRRPL